MLSDVERDDWAKMKGDNNWHEVDIRDNRYNQIIHMVSAANGAEPFYTVAGHGTRHEDLVGARNLDKITAAVSCTCLYDTASSFVCVNSNADGLYM